MSSNISGLSGLQDELAMLYKELGEAERNCDESKARSIEARIKGVETEIYNLTH